MQNLSSLMNPAGGLKYHWRALRHSRQLWLPFRVHVEAWLAQWHWASARSLSRDASETLLLVGPSAGYCLPVAFLARFRKVVVLEPDPLATLILERRLKRLLPEAEMPQLVFERRDFFGNADGLPAASEGFESFLAAYPGAPVLFCNFLGQLRFLLGCEDESSKLDEWKTRLRPLLQRRPWASFHDRLSGAPLPLQPASPHCTGRALSNDELLQAFYDGSKSGELLDHLTEGFFPENLPRQYFCWTLTRQSYHIIEAVHGGMAPIGRG